MSDIPKSKRAWSKLEALDKAITIRGELSRELLISFGLSEKHIDAAVKKATKGLQGTLKHISAARIRSGLFGNLNTTTAVRNGTKHSRLAIDSKASSSSSRSSSRPTKIGTRASSSRSTTSTK